jgi:hypothetical protein
MNSSEYINRPDDGNHSVIGASSAERWANCPGSVNLSSKCPKPKESKWAREGTLAHRVAELILKGTAEAWELIGIENVTSEMIDGALLYQSQIKNKILKTGGKLEVEKEFHLKTFDERAFGTSDAVVLNPGELHVIDYKFGAGVAVEVSETDSEDASGLNDEIANNPQLLFYALGAYMALGEKEAAKIKTIYIWVIQPRAPHCEGPIRFATILPLELLNFGFKLKKAMTATKDLNAPLKTGKHCRWCAAFLQCPEQGKLTIKEAKLDFATPHYELPMPRNLSPKDISTVLVNRDILIAWLDSVYEYARIEMQAGLKIENFKLVNGKAIRSWIDEKKAEKFLGKDAFEKKLLTPAKAEKIKGKLPEELVKKIISGPVIALAEDKRKAYIGEQVTDFNESF